MKLVAKARQQLAQGAFTLRAIDTDLHELNNLVRGIVARIPGADAEIGSGGRIVLGTEQ